MTTAGLVRFGSVRFERVRGQPAGFGVAGNAGGTGERAGLIVALAAHAALFAILSLAWGAQPPRAWPKPQPIEVSLVKDVALEATAPPVPAPLAASVAPEVGAPEEAPPPAPVALAKPAPAKPAEAKPEPAKAEPKAEPKPQPKAPAKPAPKVEPKPEPKAAAKPKAEPKPAPTKPALPKPAAKAAPAKPAPAKTAPAKTPQTSAAKSAVAATAAPTKPAARPSRLAGLLPTIAAGAKADAASTHARGHRLGDDIVAGLSAEAPAKKAVAAPAGAKPGPYPTASIVQAIARQIQPCADRQVNPGPGANRIVTTLNIRLNQDGTLAATPRKVRQAGVDDENERYAQRVTDLGIAAFKGCTPLKLPADYYDTAAGGWSNLNYRWQLR